jgi:broad specificity phosphatase PhoE
LNRIYWVRHGENWANLTKEFSCRKIDYSLTPRGQLQARQTGAYLAGQGIQAVYSSPLKRAIQTAEHIAGPLGLQVQIVEDLRELNVGTLEDQLPTPEAWALHDSILMEWTRGEISRSLPGGEDYPTLWKRMANAFRTFVGGQEDRRIAVVAHGGSLFCTLHDLCPGEDIRRLRSSEHPNCGISQMDLHFEDERPVAKIISWAAQDHLSGEAARLIYGQPPTRDHLHQKVIYLSGSRGRSAAELYKMAIEAREGWVYLDSGPEDDLSPAVMIARAGSVAKWRWVSAFCWVGKAVREYSPASVVVIAGQSSPQDVRHACQMFRIGACEIIELGE